MAAAAFDHASPTLLAEQPLTLPDARGPGRDWLTTYTHLESRLGGLRIWRYSWWEHWSRLARLLLPYRYHWVITANTTNRGSPLNDAIVDSTATLAMRTCASGMLAGLMSPSRPWFKLGVGLKNFDIDADAQEWLDDTAERIYAVLGGSNFYTEAAQLFQDVATFGTSPMIIYEDHEDVIRCYVPCAGEYFLGAGGRLSIDTLYREFVYTVTQIVDWFGLEACPEAIRKHWEEGGVQLEREFVVGHAIEPNFPINPRGGKAPVRVVPGPFPYREVYWLRGAKTEAELSRQGFHEQPFVAARWSKTSNDPYGRGPGMDAYGDTAQLQQEQRRKGEYIDKGVRPSMGASPEMENRPSSILPGDVTYIVGGKKSGEGFWALYEVQPQWLPAITADIESVQKRIERCFFVDVFMAITQMEGVQPREQMEILERKSEKIQMLGPVIELFETEVASPAIQRVTAICFRRGLLRPPPKSLHGVPISIEYVSLMKLAQRAAEIGGVQQTVALAAGLTEASMAAGSRPPLRILNLDETTRFAADRLGFPARLIFTADEVSAADQHRDQAQAQSQAMQAIPAAVSAAAEAAKIDVGGGQTLGGAMLGGQPGAQQPGAGD